MYIHVKSALLIIHSYCMCVIASVLKLLKPSCLMIFQVDEW